MYGGITIKSEIVFSPYPSVPPEFYGGGSVPIRTAGQRSVKQIQCLPEGGKGCKAPVLLAAQLRCACLPLTEKASNKYRRL